MDGRPSTAQPFTRPKHATNGISRLKSSVKDAVSIPLVVLRRPRAPAMISSRYDDSEEVTDDTVVPNQGSAARDYCALERTWLSNVRLCFLFILLSAALMLRTRLPTPNTSDEQEQKQRLPAEESIIFGSLYFVCTLALIGGGWWSYRDVRIGLENNMGFVGDFKLMAAIMACVIALIAATAIALMVQAGSEIGGAS